MLKVFRGSELAKAAGSGVILKIFNHKTKQKVTITNPNQATLDAANKIISFNQKFESISNNPAYCFDAFGIARGSALMSSWREAQKRGEGLKNFIGNNLTPEELNLLTRWLKG